MEEERLGALIDRSGKRYSEILGIDLSGGADHEVFKWFLAAILFGAPISEKSAIRTFNCFKSRRILTPEQIVETGWDTLVRILDEGGYTRYDFKTADKLLQVMPNLIHKYKGSLTLIHDEASDRDDLAKRLKELGKGIGNVTVSIFLRELRGVWPKADPDPTDLVILAAQELRIVRKNADAGTALKQLKAFWSEHKVGGKSFVDFETALFRLGKELRKHRRAAQVHQ